MGKGGRDCRVNGMSASEARLRATAKYEKKKYDKVLLRLPKGTKDRIRESGATSINGYIVKLVLEDLEKRSSPYNERG